MFKKIKSLFVYSIIAAFSFVSMTHTARAAMIGTDQVLAAETAQFNHQKVVSALDRPEVIAHLERLGVSKDDAQTRVAALTDAEAAVLANQVDALPAGAGALEVIGFVVLALVVTDLLGVTSVFPFIRPVN